MRTFLFLSIFFPLLVLGQQELFNNKAQSTFDFYLREIGQQYNPYQLHFFWPDSSSFPNCKNWGTDGFGVITNQHSILIFGYTDQALENGVYDVLQRKFGFEYYQAEALQIPSSLPKKFAYDKYESIPAFS